MAKTPFSFTDNKKDVLKKKEEKKPKMGRPKVAVKRTNKVICYFSDAEYQEVIAFLDGRPASSALRSVILEKIRD